MNILPKKSWHVRNKDNVERVRRDEAKALEEEQEVAKRRALAEQEARIRVLREKSKALKVAQTEAQWDLPQEPRDEDESEEEGEKKKPASYSPLNTAFPADKHVNLFEEFEQKKKSGGANREYEKEKKKAQEDYEKKIGYLTYLGQSASELSKDKPWYETISREKKGDDISHSSFSQQETMRTSDPLLSMKSYLDKKRQAEDVYYGRAPQVSVEGPEGSRSRKRRSSTEIRSRSKSHSIESSSHKSHKHKKSKKNKKEKSKDSSSSKLEELRAARCKREAEERQRSIDLVSRLHRGSATPARSVVDERNFNYNTVYMPKR